MSRSVAPDSGVAEPAAVGLPAPAGARAGAERDPDAVVLGLQRLGDIVAAPEGSDGAGYPRAARMLSPAEFDRCLRRPALYRDGPFALHLSWIDAPHGDATPTPAWRLGLVIPKRYEASAVARNTIKRRWRDAFRRSRAAWARELGSADLVIRLQAPLVPKAPKPTRRRGGASSAVPSPAPAMPARVRARDRFDPVEILSVFVERLRRRGGRPAATSTLSRSALEPS